MLCNSSQVDLDSPDLTAFPLAPLAPFWDVLLSPGDLLYIPPRYWHYVKATRPSCSVSFWWKPAVGADSPSPLGLHSAVLRALLDPRLSPACFPVRSSEWLPQVPPVAPGKSASSAPLVAVERPEHSPMDFLGALGRDCTAESDPAPRPLPPARPAMSVPVAPPASADQIRRRFEDQQRELARRAGRSLSPPEPLRAGSVLRSGAEAVAH
ncbi:unnamed protein product [Closterium sp. NIES-65]|nr:unnamed protein product [Closterium sp. NIES-65]